MGKERAKAVLQGVRATGVLTAWEVWGCCERQMITCVRRGDNGASLHVEAFLKVCVEIFFCY